MNRPFKSETPQNRAFRFVLLLGVVSLLADTTYEGARSITGPYLAALGATGAIVGFTSGLGELAGYGLRLISGLLSDRTRRHWTLTFAGYFLNLFSVPLLALASGWRSAAALIVSERIGKAVRTPSRDAMLSFAASRLGAGKAFGLHEALDQVGAVLGPLLVLAVLHYRQSFRFAFALLALPAVGAIAFLILARITFSRPHELEPQAPQPQGRKLPRQYWQCLAATLFIAAGFVDFPLVAYHLGRSSHLALYSIPLTYGIAMATDAFSALLLGRLFDRSGYIALALAALAGALAAPLLFLGGLAYIAVGIILWGIAMGGQETVLRAAISTTAPSEARGSAFGIFHSAFGVAWFAGSSVAGLLYDHSPLGLVIFSGLTQLASVPFFLLVFRKQRSS